jgi:cell wall-associated NlpC family hydrolase
VLKRAAQDAYIQNGSEAAIASRSSNMIANAQSGLVRAEYVSNLADSQSQAINEYQAAFQNAHDAQIVLQQAQQAAAKNAQQLAAAKQATITAQQQLQSTLSQVKGQLAQLVAQAEAAKRAAQLRAAQQALAAQRAAVAAEAARAPTRSQQLLQIAPQAQTLSNPPVGSGAGAAVSAALSRVGLPYVWGASGPSSFDCSGLVMWAWDHAGVSLPHFSGAQYADTTHISMSNLEPGDLVFPSDPGEHVAMYIGNGQIVEAPYTGADVHVVPLSSFFVYASRP